MSRSSFGRDEGGEGAGVPASRLPGVPRPDPSGQADGRSQEATAAGEGLVKSEAAPHAVEFPGRNALVAAWLLAAGALYLVRYASVLHHYAVTAERRFAWLRPLVAVMEEFMRLLPRW
ncbi:MAG: hypothetical protein HY719_11385 [Planctomycetes bacterium]|nr:hypothetical protein [Planctomycetota bacterium]